MWGRKGRYNRRGLKRKRQQIDQRELFSFKKKRFVGPTRPSNTIAGEEGGTGAGKNKFFACYLLKSINPRSKNRTYIGYTVNPKRRIRQHNGEITSGASKTKSGRPWEMVMCIYGFPSNVAALKFEWAWQNPTESVNVREAAATFKSINGLANKIKMAHTMLTLPFWQRLDLTVNYFSTKYTKHTARCPTLPRHIRLQVGSMDDLPCYTGGSIYEEVDDLFCSDEGCDKSDESQESAENGSAEGHQVINDNVPVVQGVFELRGGRARRPILHTTEISQSSEEIHQSNADCDKLAPNDEDIGVYRLPDELQSKNSGYGEQEVHSQSFRLSEEFHNGSIQHDPNSYGELPSSFTDCDELTANAEGIFRLSDELQSKNLRFASEEFYSGSILHDPNSYEDLPHSFTDCDELTANAEGIFRLSDELQSKNLRFGEQEFYSGSILHDPNSYGDLPHSFTDCDEVTANTEGIFRLSDELQSKNLRIGEHKVQRSEEFYSGSILHDPNAYEDLPYSSTHYDELAENGEVFGLSDELQSKNVGFGEQEEVLNQSSHFNDCSVPSQNKVIIIDEDEEVEASGSRDDITGCCQEAKPPKQSFQLNGCRFRTPSLSSSSSDNLETVAEHRERIFISLDDCIDDQLDKDQQPQKNAVSDCIDVPDDHEVEEDRQHRENAVSDCIDVPDDQEVEEDRQHRENAVSDKVQSGQVFSDEVEVIDLFTPSPCKKRRKRSETEIIDLTISPMII